MKRLRHYKKGTAIVLSCFGSVAQMHRYKALGDSVQAIYPDIEVHLAFGSRMVIKKLAEKGEHYEHLPLVLAQLDLEGFQRILVVPVYLFPTDEYLQIQKTVAGFNEFSLSNIEMTPAIIQNTHNANALVHAISQRYSTGSDINLFICHGAPYIDNAGHQAISYVDSMLSKLSEKNYCCTLEGAWAFKYVAPEFIRKVRSSFTEKVQVRLIPLLLVSGVHFEEDIQEIQASLEEHFITSMAEPLHGQSYCLLDEPEVKTILTKQISDGLVRLNVPDEEKACQN